MAGNSFGELFCVTSCGESHGPAYLAIVDGCPPGLALDESIIQRQLDRRRPGQSRVTTQRQELDQVQIVSGVFAGKTTGTPIGLIVPNQDARPRDYSAIARQFRPGHADFTYHHKYGIRDYRGGGRASARETVMRVAAGAIAKHYLQTHFNIDIRACVVAIGDIEAKQIDWAAARANDFNFADASQVLPLEALIKRLRREGDSIGARLYVEATAVPIGLGAPVFNKLDAAIANAMMGINAAKGVAIGSGFAAVQERGSQHRDEMDENGFLSNHAGGLLGGISNGQKIQVEVAFKPTASIAKPGRSQDCDGQVVTMRTTGRHDPCVGIRAVPVVEAMLALVLMDHWLLHKAQNLK